MYISKLLFMHFNHEFVVDVASVSRFVSNWNCVNLVSIPRPLPRTGHWFQTLDDKGNNNAIHMVPLFLTSAMRFALGFRFSLSFSLTFRNDYQRAAYFFLMHRVISQIASTMHTKYKIFVKDNFYAVVKLRLRTGSRSGSLRLSQALTL